MTSPSLIRVRYTVHGPLAINFFDEPFRLPRHFDVLKASMEVSAELDAIHDVIHAGQPNWITCQ
jgi:hypothetical protein